MYIVEIILGCISYFDNLDTLKDEYLYVLQIILGCLSYFENVDKPEEELKNG